MRRARVAIALLIPAGLSLLAVRWRTAGERPPSSREARSNAELIEAFEAQIAANPDDSESYGLLGKLYLIDAQRTGNRKGYLLAEKHLRVALGAEPSSPRLQGTHAEALLGQQRYREALAVAEDAWEGNRGELRALTVIGDALTGLGRYGDAARAFERLRALKPVPAVLARLGHLAEMRGDLEHARTLLEEALAGAMANEHAEKHDWFLTRLCRFHVARGAPKKARELCEKSLAIREDELTLVLLAEISAAEKRYEDAIALLERAARRRPDPAIHANLAELFEVTGRADLATRHTALATEIAERAPIPRVYRRFLSLFLARREGGSKRALELAREDVAERADVYSWDTLAFALFVNGRIDEAAEASTKALAHGTPEPQFHYHAGLIRRARGDAEAARAHFERALALNPYFSVSDAPAARKFLEELEHAG